jgi:hypothetical protein
MSSLMTTTDGIPVKYRRIPGQRLRSYGTSRPRPCFACGGAPVGGPRHAGMTDGCAITQCEAVHKRAVWPALVDLEHLLAALIGLEALRSPDDGRAIGRIE